MRLLKRILLVLVLLLAVASGYVGWTIKRQLPDIATPPIPGLGAEVRVTFDDRGVPTVRAASLLDAVRVQGYLVARERLFQMELMRRSADGTLAEIVGGSALPLDRRHRTFGFRQVAEAAVPLLPPAEREATEAYAAGVNAFIRSHEGHWGVEFRLLGFEPQLWTTADCIKVLLLMNEDLATSWREELQQAFLQALPPERRALLMPRSTEEDVLLVPDADPPPVPPTRTIVLPEKTLKASAALLSDPAFNTTHAGVKGSNNWVVAGSRTASGKPMLANDPHLGLLSPGTWFPLRIEWQGRFVQGAAMPGGPGVVIGQNDRLAWGFTNLMTDVQDLFWEDPIGERVERIPVKGQAPGILRVPIGRHGPQLRPGLSLQWTALDPANLRNPLLAVNTARDWTEFNAALDGFLGPAQSAVYADQDGHIGWRATGLIPKRKAGDDGSLPRNGADPANDWQGFVPQAAMPRVLDPAQGFLATANQRLIGSSFPHPVATDWASPVRAQRIVAVLSGARGWNLSDMDQLQRDTRSPHFLAFRDAALPLLPESLRAELAAWNGQAEASSRAFSRLFVLYREWRRVTLERLMPGSGLDGEDLRWANRDSVPLALLKADQRAWTRLGLGDRAEAMDLARRKAVASPEWNQTWGRANRLEIPHPIGRAGGILGWIFNPPTKPQDGASRCVRVAGPDFGQSMRFLVDWGNPEATRLVLPLGVSGHLGSAHRHDQLDAWLQGDPAGRQTSLKQPPNGTTMRFIEH
jgi:penicillin amidase